MDVSFSAWRHSREESLQLKGDSFSFLFDRRYTNRLNRMSRVFFEAYVVATKELAAQEEERKKAEAREKLPERVDALETANDDIILMMADLIGG